MSLRDRLYGLWRRPTQNVDDELRFHLEMRMEEARRSGLSEDEARASVMQRFGSYSSVHGEVLQIDTARERRRDRRELLEEIWRDLRFAWRNLRNAPAFTTAALTTLAVAIGANTAIYSVVQALLLAPLPFHNADRLVVPWFGTVGELDAMRPRWRSAIGIAGVNQFEANLDDGYSAINVQAAVVTDSFFTVLGTSAQLGRVFTDEEHLPGKMNVVLIGDGLWRRQFGADPGIIGRSISVDGRRCTVVGVMPRKFAFPAGDVALWLPTRIDRSNYARLWQGGSFAFVARLRDGVTLEAARSDLANVLAKQIRQMNPVWNPGEEYSQGLVITPVREAMLGKTETVLQIVMACALLVLVIACINVANLLLARATARERELTVRAALGGGRARLIRQLLTESVLLSSLGAILGLALAAGSVRWLVSFLPPADVPGAEDIGIHGPALAFALVLAVGTGVAFGALPAFRATRAGATDGLVRAGRGGRGPGHQRVTAILVAGEIALAVLVVASAQLLVRSFAELRRLDPGFRSEHLVTARITPPSANYGEPAQGDAIISTVSARIAALPGVEAVAYINALPLARPASGVALRVQGRFEDATQRLPFARHLQVVSPNYFSVMGIPVVKGRAFTADDRWGSAPVVIVNQDVARALWPGQDPIGKRIAWPYASPWLTVVGVVPDVKIDNMTDTTVSAIYVPFLQRPLGPSGRSRVDYTMIAKARGAEAAVGPAIRSVVTSTDRSIPVSPPQTMDEVVRESVGSARFTAWLVTAFGIVALFLGAVGIYGVMSYLVGQRAQELSVRAALGASGGELRGLVLRRAAILGAAGAATGIALSIVATRPMRSFLYGVSNVDPLTLTTVPLLFLVIALVASLGPARRAARSSPASALRSD